jgi:general secretion pathway protein D
MRSNRWTTGALALLSASLVNAQGRIEHVSAAAVNGQAEVVVEGQRLGKPKVLSYRNGRILALEFHALMTRRATKILLNQGGVNSVRVRWRSAKPPVIRVDVALQPNAPAPKVVADGARWKVTFAKAETPAPKNVRATSAKLIAQVEPEIPGLTVGVRQPLPDTMPMPLPGPTLNALLPPIKPIVTASVVAKEPAKVTLPSAPPAPRNQDVRVTLDFVNTDVVQILKALAMQSGVNIITSPEITGNLTVSLNDVTVESALKLVTSLAGAGYSMVEGTYIVATPLKLQTIYRQITGQPEPTPEASVTEVYPVHSYNADALVATVAGKGKDQVGNVTLTFTPTNVQEMGGGVQGMSTMLQGIVMRGPAGEVKALRDLFDKLLVRGNEENLLEAYDVKYVNPEALREQMVTAVPGLRAVVAPPAAANPRAYRKGEAEAQGSKTSMVATAKGGEGGAGGEDNTFKDARAAEDVREVRNARGLTQPFTEYEPTGQPMRLVLRGTPDQIRQAREYAAKVDVAPKQVALELRVMELNREEALRLGIDWTIISGNGIVNVLRLNQGTGGSSDTPGTISSGNNLRPESEPRTEAPNRVVATLDQISNRQNLIARPNLLAIDGRESELFVGDVIRYIASIQATQNGITVVTDEERVGVRLAVFPRVGDKGEISLDLRPVLSYLRGYIPVPGGGQLPQTSERMTQATTIIRSGETIALGGLIQDQDRRNVSGVPFLKDLPIIGQLFRRTDKSKVRTEVVFFLTAKVVDPETRPDAARPKEDPEPGKDKPEPTKG